MCGIAGAINYSIKDVALNKLQHRGPDSNGVWQNENVELVHLRLAILELSQLGHQPMIYKNWVITFNGEIYNYLEIKNELINLGYSFKSNSDTEVILISIDVWGIEKALNMFNGMWSFCIYNIQNNKMYLCRDRIGKKPLFYTCQNNKFIFASEIKAFPTNFLGDIDHQSSIRFLSLGFIPSPDTYYTKIKKIPPAYFLEIDTQTLDFKLINYWQIPTSKNNSITLNDAVLETESLIKSSIKYRLLADVEVGCFLSGGIDSSLITAIAQKQSNKQIKTFSIGFEIEKYDESKYAKKVATYLGTEHHEYKFTSSEILNELNNYLENIDEPFGDSAILPTLILSKITKQKVTVALSGDGGDELFAGYTRYFFTKKYYKIFSNLPKPINKIILNILPKLNMENVSKLSYSILHPTIENFYSILYTCIKPWELSNVFNLNYINNKFTECTLQKLLNVNIILNNNDIINSLMTLDKMQNLPEMMLQKVDRATMQFSLEARAPLLDFRLMEYAHQIPTSILTNGNISKSILKEILYKHIPKEFFNRPKSGFTVPLKEWFKNELQDKVKEKIYLLDSSTFNKKNILEMYNMHINNKANYQAFFFNLLQIK